MLNHQQLMFLIYLEFGVVVSGCSSLWEVRPRANEGVGVRSSPPYTNKYLFYQTPDRPFMGQLLVFIFVYTALRPSRGVETNILNANNATHANGWLGGWVAG